VSLGEILFVFFIFNISNISKNGNKTAELYNLKINVLLKELAFYILKVDLNQNFYGNIVYYLARK